MVRTVSQVPDQPSPYGPRLGTACVKSAQRAVLMKAGIIDPAKVTRSTIQNAASIAGLLITTEAIVAEEKEDAPLPMPGGGGDMHGMM